MSTPLFLFQSQPLYK